MRTYIVRNCSLIGSPGLARSLKVTCMTPAYQSVPDLHLAKCQRIVSKAGCDLPVWVDVQLNLDKPNHNCLLRGSELLAAGEVCRHSIRPADRYCCGCSIIWVCSMTLTSPLCPSKAITLHDQDEAKHVP